MMQTTRPPRGQELVEFAITLPVLILLLMIILDFGRAAYYYSALHQAAREGARTGIIPEQAANVRAVTRAAAVGLVLDASQPQITRDTNTGFITVCIDYQYQPVTQLIADLIGLGSIPMRACSVMQLEE